MNTLCDPLNPQRIHDLLAAEASDQRVLIPFEDMNLMIGELSRIQTAYLDTEAKLGSLSSGKTPAAFMVEKARQKVAALKTAA